MDTTKFDDVFAMLSREAGSVETVLVWFFSFLGRRSDFFHVTVGSDDPFGFPQGYARKMVWQAFSMGEMAYKWRMKQKMLHKDTLHVTPKSSATSTEKISKAVEIRDPGAGESENNDFIHKEPRSSSKGPSTKGPSSRETPSCYGTKSYTSRETRDENHRLSTVNGGKCEKFWWGQTIDEIWLDVPLRDVNGENSANNVGKKSTLKVSVEWTKENDVPGTNESDQLAPAAKQKLTVRMGPAIFLMGHLEAEISDHVWLVHDTEKAEKRWLEIRFEKKVQTWWTRPFVEISEGAADPKTMKSNVNFSECPEPTKIAIEKMLRSDQKISSPAPPSNIYELLKKAWQAPTCPFKNTPFDPKMFNI